MAHPENDRKPASCSLAPGDLASRRDRWRQLADGYLLTKHATDTGVRLVYRSTGDTETELNELAAAESECCSFAGWRVHRPAAGLVALEVSTDVENVGVVQAMFDLSPASAG